MLFPELSLALALLALRSPTDAGGRPAACIVCQPARWLCSAAPCAALVVGEHAAHPLTGSYLPVVAALSLLLRPQAARNYVAFRHRLGDVSCARRLGAGASR